MSMRKTERNGEWGVERLRNIRNWVSQRKDDIFLLGTFAMGMTVWIGMWL